MTNELTQTTEPTSEQIYNEIARHYTVEKRATLDGKQYYSVTKNNRHEYFPEFRFVNMTWANGDFQLRGARCQCPRFFEEQENKKSCHHVYLAVIEFCKSQGIDLEFALQVFEDYKPAKVYLRNIKAAA